MPVTHHLDPTQVQGLYKRYPQLQYPAVHVCYVHKSEPYPRMSGMQSGENQETSA